MKFLYKQPVNNLDPGAVFFRCLGVHQCYFKHLFSERDAAGMTYKRHHHTHYEVHMVESGCVGYEVDGKEYILNIGHFLVLPPQTAHQATLRQPGTSTLSITFRSEEDKCLLPALTNCVTGEISAEIKELIATILAENTQRQFASTTLIAASLAQILIRFWRLCGVRKSEDPQQIVEADPRLSLAIQYICDNIEYSPTVSEVAAYCHLSTKQLTRLFLEAEEPVPSEYIRQQRIRRIEELLKDPQISLRSISETMHFSSEFYFNTFFKKESGMTPGEFRKMHRQIPVDRR